MPGGDFVGIFHGTEKLKADCALALPANRKPVTGQQRGFMHQTVRVMGDAINAAFRDHISGPMFPFQKTFSALSPKREHAILKTSKVAGKATMENHESATSAIRTLNFRNSGDKSWSTCDSNRLRYNRATF
jgi:hypothetical protein